MTTHPLKTATLLLATSVVLGCAGSSNSYDSQPYVTNGGDTVVRVKDREGRCIRTPAWTEETATRECDPQLFPAETAVVAAPVYESLTLSANALFGFDSAVIKQEGLAALQQLGDKIEAKGAEVVDIDIIGHTDSVGAEDYNQQLSERRASAMRDFLVNERGIDSSIIDVSGMGESSPIGDNGTAEGRAQNRRVEVRVGVKAPQ
ncbi:OmpA family protein [Halioglobus maricola]|uniref:OmpA family protein n=1 Tax=Halioglobus maricola TaxID=2601894 RepID=A0A5P9NEZ9_9GAMM|nr:OmpA family protein [Halioglobus maricola]QFU74331.1 OmpA family protein [Halioglobus maricola]